MEFSLGIGRFAALILAISACLVARNVSAQTDFADPGDTMIYLQKQKASHSSYPELDGTIDSTSTAKPGWYAITLNLDNGKSLKVMVVPATRFYKDYTPLASHDAYSLLIKGCKIRVLHDPDKDQLLRNIIITDLMFPSPPVECAGTIKNSLSTVPGVYDLTVDLKDGSERHLYLDPKTKFWKNNEQIDLSTAYPQLVAGHKFRAMEVPTPNGQQWTSDLMFVDQ